MDKFKKFILDEINNMAKEGDVDLYDITMDLGIDTNEILCEVIKKELKSANDETILQLYRDYCIDC